MLNLAARPGGLQFVTTQAMRSIEAMRAFADRPGMGTVIPMTLFDLVGTSAGFGLSAGRGLTLVHADNTGADWAMVFVCSGLALDVPDPQAALEWVNAQNRQTAIGKYYCAVAQDQRMAAVVYEHGIWGGHFQHLLEGPHGPGTFQSIGGWILALLKDAVDAGDEFSGQLLARHGGRPFPPDENGLMTLFTIVSG
jgi:hypothetical protein